MGSILCNCYCFFFLVSLRFHWWGPSHLLIGGLKKFGFEHSQQWLIRKHFSAESPFWRWYRHGKVIFLTLPSFELQRNNPLCPGIGIILLVSLLYSFFGKLLFRKASFFGNVFWILFWKNLGVDFFVGNIVGFGFSMLFRLIPLWWRLPPLTIRVALL